MRHHGACHTVSGKPLDGGPDFIQCAAFSGHSLLGNVNRASSIEERIMKKSLFYVCVIAMTLASCLAMYAQMPQEQVGVPSGRGPGQSMTADQRLERMSKQLNLSEAQQQQIKPILENEST